MRISDLKKFVLKFLVFCFCMILVDSLCGVSFPVIQKYSKSGSTRTNFYLSNECDADVLVLGSSRAMHHYVPMILDSLGGKAYNAGNDGMGVVLGYGRYLMCSEKHVPKIVIYDMSVFDYIKDDNSKYLKFLRPYGDREYIRSIISQIGEPFSDLKLLSHMYRNTSRIIPNVRDLLIGENVDLNRGYLPLYKICSNCNKDVDKYDAMTLELDSMKIKMFDQFVSETVRRGSKLYLSISPRFFNEKPDGMPPSYVYALKLAERYNVPLLNNIFTPDISDNHIMFADLTHMNKDGATLFTRKIVEKIRSLEKNKFLFGEGTGLRI